MGRLQSFLREYHPIVHSLVAGTVFVRAASSMSMPFLFIYLSKNTDMDLATIGLTIGAGSLAGTVGGFVGGTLSDIIGRRRVMLAALYLWVFVFFGFAYGESPWFFFLLNVLSGLCRSFYEPVSQALMADLTPPDKRYRVFAMRYTAINLGVAVGPIIGALLALQGDALPFLLTGAIYLLYVISLQFLLHFFGIRQIEGQKKEQITFKKAWDVVIHDAAFRFYIIGGILGAIGYSQMSSTLSKFVEMTVPDGMKLFAVLMSVNAIVVVLLQIPCARWSEKRTPIQSILVGNLMYALGDLGYAMADGWILFILSMAVFTLGEILTFTSSDVMIDRLAPEEMRGAYYGAKSFSNIGHFVGPWLGGILLAHYSGSVLFTTVAAISMLGSVFYWAGDRAYFLRTGHHISRRHAG
ncbi:MFS transporter [Brevibacillus sp. SYP-B805]|uniref:MDR family MFS transporter n=1 Tax=Brevibacillus sp. SYP-B805 TaxID=1578199 RepID=UPI0013EA298B|nr:MFS transporter [Brevibacillus sp. SYP-B805]NGQ95383.1 MFS transporter [Brevibacillus sp. SYP-B805]